MNPYPIWGSLRWTAAWVIAFVLLGVLVLVAYATAS